MDRWLAVKYGGDVMMTTDLTNWTCIGKALADATSIGSLDGVVYFGSVNGGVYGFPAPSWDTRRGSAGRIVEGRMKHADMQAAPTVIAKMIGSVRIDASLLWVPTTSMPRYLAQCP